MQYCRIVSLDNNNSVKFTSSREDNSTTNDSMVMKIAHAQLHMYTNIMYKFEWSTCKTVGEKFRTKLRPDRRTDSHGNSSIHPSTLLWGGIKMESMQQQSISYLVNRRHHLLTFLLNTLWLMAFHWLWDQGHAET